MPGSPPGGQCEWHNLQRTGRGNCWGGGIAATPFTPPAQGAGRHGISGPISGLDIQNGRGICSPRLSLAAWRVMGVALWAVKSLTPGDSSSVGCLVRGSQFQCESGRGLRRDLRVCSRTLNWGGSVLSSKSGSPWMCSIAANQ